MVLRYRAIQIDIYLSYLSHRLGAAGNQWSFRKTGTIGTLVSQAAFGVWVQAQRALALPIPGTGFGRAGDECGRGSPLPLLGPEYYPGKFVRLYMQISSAFWQENGSQCRP